MAYGKMDKMDKMDKKMPSKTAAKDSKAKADNKGYMANRNEAIKAAMAKKGGNMKAKKK